MGGSLKGLLEFHRSVLRCYIYIYRHIPICENPLILLVARKDLASPIIQTYMFIPKYVVYLNCVPCSILKEASTMLRCC